VFVDAIVHKCQLVLFFQSKMSFVAIKTMHEQAAEKVVFKVRKKILIQHKIISFDDNCRKIRHLKCTATSIVTEPMENISLVMHIHGDVVLIGQTWGKCFVILKCYMRIHQVCAWLSVPILAFVTFC